MSKERVLGKAEKRSYDLPLNRGAGTGFLIILIALMTFLAMLAMASSFALSAMTERWSSGLENRLTVEIPTQGAKGELLDRATITTLTDDIATRLKGTPGILNIHVLDDDEIQKLIEPWLGQDVLKGDFPIPGLISLETTDMNPGMLEDIQGRIKQVAPHARLDTHEEWLNDLLRFTGALNLSAIILAIVIGITTVTAVGGAVRSRLAIHRAEVELLHLMGASDQYITRQFQRHSLILALRGGAVGALLGGLFLLVIGWVAGKMGVGLLPDFHLSLMQGVMLALIPLLAGLIATLTARWTVSRVLTTFP